MLILGLVIALVMHEAAHALTTVSRGLRVKRVVVNWRGIGVARERGTEMDTFFIALAGPLMNLALAVVAVIFQSPEFVTANVIMFVINLLPIPGSDGQKAAKALWMATR